MKRFFLSFICLLVLGSPFFPHHIIAQEAKTIQLLKPDTSGGKPLMQALSDRKTTRTFSEKPLPDQVLANLLWAAFGINRPDGHRTAPSAMNWQEIDIFVAMKTGVYLYDAGKNALHPVSGKDIRELTGTQDFVKDAPVTLVYVADLAKVKRATGEDRLIYLGADCGFIAQNVYLYCASEGLACVVRGSVEREGLAKALNLRDDQQIILAQTVGLKK